MATKLLAFRGGIVQRLPDQQFIDINDAENEIYHHMTVGDVANEYHTNLDGCGYIISKAENVKKAENVASKILEKISECIF